MNEEIARRAPQRKEVGLSGFRPPGGLSRSIDMSAFHVLPIALALIMSPPSMAQEAAAPAAPANASIPTECARHMAGGGDAADKGSTAPTSAACQRLAAAKPKAKAKTGHDHARVHKLM
jgi:hypothetical protein